MDTNRHQGTVALITGAAAGIGRATALRFAKEGATVVATDVDAARLDQLAAEQANVVGIAGDLRDGSFVDRLVEQAEAVGPVSVLANVAGIMDHFLPASEVDDGTWATVLDVNLTAPLRLCRRLLPRLADRRGSIVNVASAAGLGGAGAGAAYTVSKHGLIGLTRHIAFTYAPQGVRCNAVCPGGTATDIASTAAPQSEWAFERHLVGIALAGPMAQPDEIAAVISFLASSEAGNVNGAIVAVDGGWRAA